MSFSTILGIFLGIIGFLFLITIHEGGHFCVAKLLGVRVNEFSVGMGPLLTSKEINGTKYSFRALPIGGYCALEKEFPDDATDEEIENYVDDDPAGFVNQPAWKQILVMFAGPFINFVCGLLTLIIVYIIVAAGNVGLGRILEVAWSDCFEMIDQIVAFLGGLFNGSSSVKDVSGVVGVVSIVAQSASYGIINVFYLLGLLSVNLCIMNLLPIPGLDGGRILITAIRVICGGKLKSKTENIINAVGIAFLLGIIVLITIKDVIGLF